jgi:hypothetical protein
MHVHGIADHELDDCIEGSITVLYVKADRTEHDEGVFLHHKKPWNILLRLPTINRDIVVGAGYLLPFLGIPGAIERITHQGRVVDEHTQLPRPNPRFDFARDEDFDALNEMRRQTWGDLYRYRRDQFYR